jgi:2-C-methyl-D-erythritol 2,4-cyclodiphosphate synthase
VRVGQGIDVHAFADDDARPLVLGGVTVPGAPGLAGHSDGDVVLHALADALLGAAGAGDLGSVFGTADPAYAGASSEVFVRAALRRAAEAGWGVANADLTVVAQRPRLAGHRAAITEAVTRLIGAPVSVKATSTDGLGVTGRGEGMACLAVVLLVPVERA